METCAIGGGVPRSILERGWLRTARSSDPLDAVVVSTVVIPPDAVVGPVAQGELYCRPAVAVRRLRPPDREAERLVQGPRSVRRTGCRRRPDAADRVGGDVGEGQPVVVGTAHGDSARRLRVVRAPHPDAAQCRVGHHLDVLQTDHLRVETTLERGRVGGRLVEGQPERRLPARRSSLVVGGQRRRGEVLRQPGRIDASAGDSERRHGAVVVDEVKSTTTVGAVGRGRRGSRRRMMTEDSRRLGPHRG